MKYRADDIADLLIAAALIALIIVLCLGCAHECGPDTPQRRDPSGHPNFGP